MSDPNVQELVRPFAALRPADRFAGAVAAPPYDVMNSSEARALAAGNPHSFLHVSRAEIDLPQGTDPYSDAVYATAARNLAGMREACVLIRDTAPAYYAYRVSSGSRSQIGIAVAASVAAYNEQRIRRHELTRPAKETDRVRQIEAVRAITGPVMLVHRADAALTTLLAEVTTASPPPTRAEVDGWQHAVWPITNSQRIATISAIMNAMPGLYIADGHHRSAAAARLAAKSTDGSGGSAARYNCDSFLAVSFADDEMQILDYNRVVSSLNGLSREAFLAALAEAFIIERCSAPVRPQQSCTFGLYLPGQWYSLTLRKAPPHNDPIARLDVSVLDHTILAPLLGIHDPRTDDRIDFVGGSRGPEAVAARVDAGTMQAGFMLYPTAMSELLAVADAGLIMPPKSTWFEPKLADGLLSLVLD